MEFLKLCNCKEAFGIFFQTQDKKQGMDICNTSLGARAQNHEVLCHLMAPKQVLGCVFFPLPSSQNMRLYLCLRYGVCNGNGHLFLIGFLEISHFIYQETKHKEYQGKNLSLGGIRSVSGPLSDTLIQPTRASLGDNTGKKPEK